MTDHERGVSVNVGVVNGGTRDNVVAASAEASLDVRIVHTADVERVERALHALEPVIDGTSIAVTGTWTRPPLEPTPASRRLFTKAREHGQALGLELGEASSGGGSDANLVGALGVPVLDGLAHPKEAGGTRRHRRARAAQFVARAGGACWRGSQTPVSRGVLRNGGRRRDALEAVMEGRREPAYWTSTWATEDAAAQPPA